MTVSTSWIDPSPAGALDLVTGDVLPEAWTDGVASDLLSLGGTKGLLPLCQGRLTLASGCPITTSDVSNASNVYFTPYKGDRVALFDGTLWKTLSFTEITHALGTVTSAMCYDFFLYASGSTILMEKEVWSTNSSRLKNLTYQNGMLVKSGCATSLYVGTIYTSSTAYTQDTTSQRFLWNYYNRVERNLVAVDTTDTWTYTTAAWRAQNANTTDGVGRISCVIGWSEDLCEAINYGDAYNDPGGVYHSVGIGIDSQTVNSAQAFGGYSLGKTVQTFISSFYKGVLSIGYHYIQRLEISLASGTTTWVGDNGTPNAYILGMVATIRA